MKASRLLSLLLLLQARQRMTTAEIAERLEVSRRTVLRDVEALSAAGVPVYAERGRRGGIVLLHGARLNASHLDPDEIDVLRLTGLDAQALALLGLTSPAEAAERKLAARSSSRSRTALHDPIVVDNAGWGDPAASDPLTHLAELAESLQRGRRWRIDYRRSGEPEPTSLVVDPYGLAVKGGRWYLVADAEGVPRLFALIRLVARTELDEPVRHRPGATLASVWDGLRAPAVSPGSVEVQGLLRTSRVDLARRILGTRLSSVAPGAAAGTTETTWSRITVQLDDLEGVRQLLQFGDHLTVLSPPAARARVSELALDLASRHSDPD